MKRTELDTIFTAKVNEYLANGYMINTNTMGGSQGEIAHIDLRKGDEILRIVMERKYDCLTGDKIHIKVGRNTNRVRLDRESCETIWNQDLEIIEDLVFAKITNNWYASEEEGLTVQDLRNSRYCARFTATKKSLTVTMSFIRSLKTRTGFSNATRNNIKVTRDKSGYTIELFARDGHVSRREVIKFPVS